jgi:adenylate cyclase
LTGERVQRRLAAVLAAEVAGYDRLMAADEEGMLSRLFAIKKTLVDPAFAAHRSRVIKASGDRMLVEFASAVDAVRSAIEVQGKMAEQNAALAPEQWIEFRIGIHVGDIIFDDNDIFGDGVNIAARIEDLAEPGGICLSESVHRELRGKVDIGCDDLGPQVLKNIAGPVQVWRVRFGAQGAASPHPPGATPPQGSAIASPAKAPPLALPIKPSIAVLPFDNMSNDPAQEYFADGLVEDIITALSRFKSLFVIARNSSFTYKGKVVDIRQVGRELGVRYVLEGSVRKAGSRLRITGQLIDAATGAHLWAEKFDGALEDVFELQDKVATSVAGIIDPLLLDTEIRRAAHRPTADMNSYDLYLRALPLIRAWAREPIAEAITFLETAVARDPNYGPALASLALCHSQNFLSGWGDPAVESGKARTLARRAREAAPEDPMSITSAAGALLSVGEDTNVLRKMVDGALARNPSHAFGWLWSGWIHTVTGEADLAIEHFEMSLRLDPRAARKAFHLTGLGICHFWRRRFDKAVAILETSFDELPSYTMTLWFLAACYAQMGRVAEARDFAARHGIVRGGQGEKVALMYGDPEQRELLISGLKLATAA